MSIKYPKCKNKLVKALLIVIVLQPLEHTLAHTVHSSKTVDDREKVFQGDNMSGLREERFDAIAAVRDKACGSLSIAPDRSMDRLFLCAHIT